MTSQEPITPPPELVRHWSRFQGDTDPEALWFRIATRAAQWGADQELEAICEFLGTSKEWNTVGLLRELRTSRRPKPPSLKEQALALLQPGEPRLFNSEMQDTLRRALEQLDD